MLIERASGDRSIHKFAKDADISYVQLRKLHAGQQENPPGKKLIKKLSENSLGGVEYEDYLFAAGLDQAPKKSSAPDAHDMRIVQQLSGLSAGQRKTAEEFIEFLSRRNRG